MTDNHSSYAELSVASFDTTIRADDVSVHPESFDIKEFEPEALQVHNPSVSALQWKSALAPIGTFTFSAVLAASHHAFNAGVNGRPVAGIIVPQDWVTRIGVGFSLGFKTVLGATMAFVLLQCLWLSLRRRPLTIKEIDTLYHIERCNNLYQTLPQALFFSPLLVLFSILTLLLPFSGVFAPGSLTVTTKNYTNPGPCIIPTGNLSSPGYSSLGSQMFLLDVDDGYQWDGISPSLTSLITQWFIEQRIPDLPQACGQNCLYRVSDVHSFVFKCQPNPAFLPYGQLDDPLSLESTTLWNATTDPNSTWAFYIAWKSDVVSGTSGNAYCSPFLAHYDVEVRATGGIQSLTTNVTMSTSPIPVPENLTFNSPPYPGSDDFLWLQIASLSYATQALFLGNITLDGDGIYDVSVPSVRESDGDSDSENGINTLASQASFLSLDDNDFSWQDVLQGIEDMSHNVSVGLLSAALQLGNMSAECIFIDQPSVVYQYNSLALWMPYGITLGVTLLSLIVAIIIMVKHNTGQISTSFSDTIRVTRRVEEVSESGKLSFRVVNGGKLEYIVVGGRKGANVQEKMDGSSL